MTNEEAKAYFIDSNKQIISVAKDENMYNYETQQIEYVFMRRDFEAKELAIKALELVNDFERARIITGGRLNGRTQAYKCGLADGQRQTRWIPVSERLPKQYEEVIVTDVETSDTYTSIYLGNGYWECDNGSFKNRIIAWQPKPKPYKEE